MGTRFLTRRKLIVGLIAAFALLAVGGTATVVMVLHDYPTHHFGVVRPGVLYRSSQPNDVALRRIRREAGSLKTVVNLRGEQPDAPWYVDEKRYCEARQIKLVNVTMGDANHIHSNIRTVLEVLADKANQPVLVHCEAGSARTGFAVAAYRIALEGWSFAEALDEAHKYRFDPKVNLNPEYVKVLRELEAGADWRQFTDPPSPVAPYVEQEEVPWPEEEEEQQE
jgi:protein tyrosine phosphatase (PTP) superfamily phosphohydrolase (DUF442 family)